MSFKPASDAARTDDRENTDKIDRILKSLFLILFLGIIAALNFFWLLRAETLMKAIDHFLIIAGAICFLRWRSFPLIMLFIVVESLRRSLLSGGLEPVTFAELGVDQSFFKGALIGALAAVAVFVALFKRKSASRQGILSESAYASGAKNRESPHMGFRPNPGFLKVGAKGKPAQDLMLLLLGFALMIAIIMPRFLNAQTVLGAALYSCVLALFILSYSLDRNDVGFLGCAIFVLDLLVLRTGSLSPESPLALGANTRALTWTLLVMLLAIGIFAALFRREKA